MKAKHNRMRGADSGFVGIISTKEEFDQVRFGEASWKEHVNHKMTAVQIPVDIFYELIREYNEYEDMGT